MCSIELEPCEVWCETPRVARKDHRCSCCKDRIRPGDAYLVHFSVFEGEPEREKSCFWCWLAREEFAEEHGQSCTPSNLTTMLRECISENDAPEDRALNRSWKRMLRTIERRRERAEARP